MQRQKKRPGIGATVSCNTRRQQIPVNHVTFGLEIVQLKEENVCQKMQMCYVLRHMEYVSEDDETALE